MFRNRQTFLFAAVMAAATAVLCGGCSDSGIAKAIAESRYAKDDISRYATVTIGTQTWTARNLDLKTGDSWCYDNDQSNCEEYGRLYDYYTAVRICPNGWRLPTVDDWRVLIENTGGTGKTPYDNSGRAPENLRAKRGWSSGHQGTDAYGFSALPGGNVYNGNNGNDFNEAGESGYWWATGTYYDERRAYSVMIRSSDMGKYGQAQYIEILMGGESEGQSVRCIKE